MGTNAQYNSFGEARLEPNPISSLMCQAKSNSDKPTSADPLFDGFLTVAFDFETTGVSAARDRVVQVGAFGAGIEFNSLVYTSKKIADGAHKVHGISAADLKGKPAFGEVLGAFLSECDTARQQHTPRGGQAPKVLLVAHNGNAFDFRMLIYEMHRHDVGLDVLRARGVHFWDTLVSARAVNRKGISNNLGALFEQVTGDSMVGAHDALFDCKALLRVAHHPPFSAAAQIESLDAWLSRISSKSPLRGLDVFCPRCKDDVWDNRALNAGRILQHGEAAKLCPDLVCMSEAQCGWKLWPSRQPRGDGVGGGGARTKITAVVVAREDDAKQQAADISAEAIAAGIVGVCKTTKAPCKKCLAHKKCANVGSPGHKRKTE